MSTYKPFHAFPISNIAPADEVVIRRSEGSMVELPDGTFFLAYGCHRGANDNDKAPVMCKKLDAEGRPLTEERVLVAPPENGLNSISPAVRWMKDGRIGMVYSHRMGETLASRLFRASADNGETWTEPTVVAEGHYKTGCHDRLTVHSSGRLLAPVHVCVDRGFFHFDVRVSRSDDHGATWTLSDPVELPKVHWLPGSGGTLNVESGCLEPGIAERADGSVIMTIRTAMGTQFYTESFDRGETWMPPRSSEVISPAAPANISRIPGTDDLLLLWTSDYTAMATHGGERHTLMACVSKDGGRTWPHENRKLVAQDLEHNLDYPSVTYRNGELFMTIRISTGKGILHGLTSIYLMRIPVSWFYEAI